ncbi:MAG: maltokinase N-terminal cap-like domain-containing protein [Candidatus Rokuibacteriota bacterium]
MSLPSPAALAAWLPDQRWFAGKTQRIDRVVIEARIPVGGAFLVLARVRLADGTDDRYALPLVPAAIPGDALDDPGFARSLLSVVADAGRVAGDAGIVTGHPTSFFPRPLPENLPSRRVGAEQSNTSIAFGTVLMLKQFRRLPPGLNPEEELTRFLTERTSFAHAPRLLGSLAYEATSGERATLAVAHELIDGAGDGWNWMLAELRALTPRAGAPPPSAAPTLAALRRLGERTGQLHTALASDTCDPAFAPEPITDADLRRWSEDVDHQIVAARVALGGALPIEAPDVRSALAGLRGVTKIRHHGDFHLGQTLYVPARADFTIVDFEGEPLRPLAERRRKHAAARDVAGMLRSISYAAAAGREGEEEVWRETWAQAAARAFRAGYLAAAAGARFLPPVPAALARALAAFELEKAAYEVVYEANHRPSWLSIPIRGLVSAAARVRAEESAAWG